MKKKTLVFALAMLVNQVIGLAQENNLSAIFYEINDTKVFQISGSNPQTAIEFYSEKGGGKLLQTNITDKDGSLVFKSEKSFVPAFVLNRVGQNKEGKKGNGFVRFIGPREFALKEVALTSNENMILSWNASFSEANDYEMEVLRSSDDNTYTVIAVLKPVLAAGYQYHYADIGLDRSTGYSYKIRVQNARKAISYISDPLSAGQTPVLSVYPTLSSTSINLKLDKGIDGEGMVSYSIVNSLGQVIHTSVLGQIKQAVISTENLAPGKYIISVVTSKEKTMTADFIKL